MEELYEEQDTEKADPQTLCMFRLHMTVRGHRFTAWQVMYGG
jgi:hypothetical protein